MLDAVSNPDYLWTLDPVNGTVPIPYVVDDDTEAYRYRSDIRENIARAVTEFNEKTCIR